MRHRNGFRLAALILVHFSVDFCGGLLIPLPEPTLTQHLGVDLPRVALLIGASALVVNAVQPVAGWLLPRRGIPVLLVVAPLGASLVSWLGLTHSCAAVMGLLLLSALFIGVVHPEGALAAHALPESRKGVSVSLFMSGGYFGYASGGLVAGLWVERHQPGLTRFWLLGIPVMAAAVLAFVAGLHRTEGHAAEPERTKTGQAPFGPVLALGVCMAINACLIARLITILLVRRFPGEAAQAWGGTTVFASGLSGAVGAYAWAQLSERLGRGKTIALAQMLCAPFLYQLLHVDSPRLAPFWALGLGLTTGSVFPLTVVLARQAKGMTSRLRLGLVMGGAWGVGEIAFVLAGKYVGLFPGRDPEPVSAVLNVCWILLAAGTVLAAVIARHEARRPGWSRAEAVTGTRS